MADMRPTPELKLDGIPTDEAFSILGNETRLDIIRALWEEGAMHEYDDLDASVEKTVRFSKLRKSVDIEDNGLFNYHLSKLVPHFVHQAEEGYYLSGAGKKIARAVVAVSGDVNFENSDEPERECPLCESSVEVTYEDQWLKFRCTECEGLFGDSFPSGSLLNSNFPAAGLTGRTPDEAFETEHYRCHLDLTYMMRGICRECASAVSASVSVCENHDTDGAGNCACGTPFEVWVNLRCETCSFAKRLPVEICVMGLTPVIAFLYRNDVDLLAPEFDEVISLLRNRFETTVSEDPFRANVSIETEEDELELTLDDEMNVRDVSG